MNSKRHTTRTSGRRPPRSLSEKAKEAVRFALSVNNPRFESTAQTIVNHLESALLPRAEFAAALTRKLCRFRQTNDTTNALLTRSQVIELLNDVGRDAGDASVASVERCSGGAFGASDSIVVLLTTGRVRSNT